MSTIGEKIRLIREGLGMGRQEFADKTGIAKGTLVRAEQGQNSPQADILVKIAEVWPEYAAYLLTDKFYVEQIAHKPQNN